MGNQTATTTGSATTTERKALGVTGYRTETRKHATFPRYAYLSAVDLHVFRTTGKLVEVWRTVITSRGYSDDLRRVFPVMMAAAMRRLAANTGGKTEIVVSESHPRVRYIRGELSAEALRQQEARK